MQKEFTFTVTLTFDEDLAGQEARIAELLAEHLVNNNQGVEFACELDNEPLVEQAEVSYEIMTRHTISRSN